MTLPVPSFLTVTKPQGPRLRTAADLFPYQQKAIVHQTSMANSMMWLDMGLGKTVITLSAIAHLRKLGVLRGVIIVAPIRVCKMVWRQEALKWEHTKHLKFSLVTGNKDSRARAMMQPADVYLVNYENLKWLSSFLHTYYLSAGIPVPANGLVFDEVSKCKNSTTNRVKSFLKIEHCFDWTTGLTGTPASNGYKDLHGQYLVIDKGQRLGRHKTPFKTKFYQKEGPYKEVPLANAETDIKALISDITLEMSAADYNPLPDMIVNDVSIEMTGELRDNYEKLEREMFLQLDECTVEVFNKAALMNKCLQYGAGALYHNTESSDYQVVHDLKLDALEDIIDEAQGNPVLCAYSFKSDADRIMKRFKDLRPVNLTECKSQKSLDEAMRRWKSGDCPLMLAHPASAGHGIDGLQENGNVIVWFGLNWSLDLYSQMNARILRQGQGKPVMCHRIMVTKTVDQIQSIALDSKATTQDGLRRSVKQYRLEKGV
jgi:SNF2 family DNA or RNA helicase